MPRVKKYLYILFFIFITIHITTNANATLRVHWDCFLPDTTHAHRVDCQQLRNMFFTVPFLRDESQAQQAQVSIHIRSTPLANDTQFRLTFSGRPRPVQTIAATTAPTNTFRTLITQPTPTLLEAPTAEPTTNDELHFTIIDPISFGLSTEEATVQLIGDLHRGLAPFLTTAETPNVRDGRLQLTLTAPGSNQAGTPNTASSRYWYISPQGSVNFAQNSVRMFNTEARLHYNYSNPRTWRTQVNLNVRYEWLSIPGADGTVVSADVFNVSGRTIIARSLPRGWSVAVIGHAAHLPQDNQQIYAHGAAGIEWNLVPYRRNNENTIAFRYTIGPNYTRFRTPNIRNNDWETYITHHIEAVAVIHLQDVDMTLSAGGTSIVDEPRFSRLYGSASFNIRLTPRLILTPTFHISFRNALINEPAMIADSDILAQLLGSNNYGSLTYHGGMNLSYILGNPAPLTQDMRWRTH